MSKLKIYSAAVCAIMALLAAVSCQRDPNGGGQRTEGEKTTVGIRLAAASPFAPGGRSAATSSGGQGMSVTLEKDRIGTRAGENEENPEESYEVADLWILQFVGGVQPVEPVYLLQSEMTLIVSDSDMPEYEIEAELYKASESVVWFVANTGDPSLFDRDLTLAGFRAMDIPVSSQDEVRRHINKMSGSYQGAVSPETGMEVPMYRMVSKLTLNVTFDSPFAESATELEYLELWTVQVKSVPRSISYAGGAGDSYRFPEIDPGMSAADAWSAGFMNYEVVGQDYYDLRNPWEPLEWYVPENIRGVNSAIAGEMKKWARTDPSWNDPYSYATHVVMEGTYQVVSKDDYSTLMDARAQITIYPGEDVVNDFNVKRNTHYTLNAGITKLAGWDIGDYDDPAKDNRVVIASSYIRIEYYYEGEPSDDIMSPFSRMATAYITESVTAGDSYSPPAEVVNAYKGQIPAAGEYQDGRAIPDPLVVSADNAENVMRIFYFKAGSEGVTGIINCYMGPVTEGDFAVTASCDYNTFPPDVPVRIEMFFTFPSGAEVAAAVSEEGNVLVFVPETLNPDDEVRCSFKLYDSDTGALLSEAEDYTVVKARG